MKLKTVTNCARCGGDHTDVDAHEFGRPCGEHTHWSTCPTTGEPVLVRIVTDAEQCRANETVTLRVTPEDAAALRALAHNLRTQDNRSTADPLFAVQQIREVWHVDPDEADRVEWLDSDFESRADDELSDRLEAIFETSEWERSDEEQALLDAHRRCACKEVWEAVTTCLTEAGCEDYLSINGHNLNRPRIYALGGYRNRELHLLRRVLACIEVEANDV